jgi:undecaprenyl phosphate N,N'-diacetylbacillosamine 1-phosphate transferase
LKTVEKLLKRIIDIAGGLTALILLSPFMLAASLAVKLTSPGPVLFLQERVGKDGNLFTIFKFRTMEVGAEKKGLGYEIVKDDPRITRIGAFLRRWSIDEFPQVFNVLRGEMSLVGPRPTLKYQVDSYDDFQKRRLEVKPGLTGLATVKGRNLLSWNERIEYDVWYIDNYSLLLDLKILLSTFRVVFAGEGVYTDNLDKFKIKPSEKNCKKNTEPN